jgi:hypothetical protein
LAIWGTIKLTKSIGTKGLFLLCWLVAFPFLIKAPIPTQRRFAEGIWVVLVAGFFGFFTDKDQIPIYGKILLGCLLPTSVIILWGAATRAANPSEPVFLPRDEINAYAFFAETIPRDSIVLSTFGTGNTLPAWAPITVIQGHGPETINRERLGKEIEAFFLSTRGGGDCGNFLHEKQVDFIFWGPQERAEWDWDPDRKSCLVKVYNANEYRVYEVKH